ncbi:MAG: hypothetical protein ACC650_08295, partial [Gammaproteobacteria bacterium]
LPGKGGPVHNIIVPAFVDGQTRLYSIDMAFTPNRTSYQFRYTRHQFEQSSLTICTPPYIALAGTGGMFLDQNKICNKRWRRDLIRLVKAHDKGHVSNLTVADHFAKLNYGVHSEIKDKSVGPNCIVSWRYRKGGVHKGGGGHQSYSGKIRNPSIPLLPSIINGMDVNAIAATIMPARRLG